MTNKCTENYKFWRFIYKLEKIRNEKIILTPIERYNLCNYMNGLPFDRKALQRFV